MPARNLNAILLVAIVSLMCHWKAERNRISAPVRDAIELIDHYYVDEVDNRQLIEGAMKGLTSELDLYTQYIPPGAYESFQDVLQQEFAGIGVLVDQPTKDEPTRVITPLVGSPAMRAGFLPGDQIIQVSGQDTSKMSMSEVSKLLRGPIGTTVDVVVRRPSPAPPQEVRLRVERAIIQMESVQGDHRDSKNQWVYRLAENPRIAYVRLTGFGERTSRELADVLTELDNDFEGLVLDLRANSGGLLTSAVEVCDLFLDGGRIVSTKGRGILASGRQDSTPIDEMAWDAEPGTLVDDDRPMAVLIDSESASAAEIVAACLKDHDRATIVGERSFGKGSVQNVFPLENGRSALKLTTARYYRPNGHNIHRAADAKPEDEWGVKPDEGYEVKLTEDQQKRLILRWERTTYPSIASLPEPELDGPAAPPEPSATEDSGDPDPALSRAIEAIQAAAIQGTKGEVARSGAGGMEGPSADPRDGGRPVYSWCHHESPSRLREGREERAGRVRMRGPLSSPEARHSRGRVS